MFEILSETTLTAPGTLHTLEHAFCDVLLGRHNLELKERMKK